MINNLADFSDPVYDAIKEFLTSKWAYTNIQWPNELIEYPLDPTTTGDAFIRISMTGSGADQVSIGAENRAENRWDRHGTLWIYVIARKFTDFTNVSGAANAIVNIFRGVSLIGNSLEFRGTNINPGDHTEDGAWFIVPVSINWVYFDAH